MPGWPPLPGDYLVGDATAPVALCTLSDRPPLEPLTALPGVAIAGRLVTVNLDIERPRSRCASGSTTTRTDGWSGVAGCRTQSRPEGAAAG
ncbi:MULTISPECIES: hypothetical protein [unclassified Marichromatium]|uniref:hypothetical protein n=1 Tax=unclassified Marichromatium TaxID=2618417 RepID=UPI000F3ADFA6|nr:hypothetical protein EBL84_14045 [Marichromatium sp. AB31]RNE93159.1 hypothetical protein EBL85_08500 [Marichromatium sp. AB32]